MAICNSGQKFTRDKVALSLCLRAMWKGKNVPGEQMKLIFTADEIFNNRVAKGIPHWDMVALADECREFVSAKAAPFNEELEVLARDVKIYKVLAVGHAQDRKTSLEQVTKLREALEWIAGHEKDAPGLSDAMNEKARAALEGV